MVLMVMLIVSALDYSTVFEVVQGSRGLERSSAHALDREVSVDMTSGIVSRAFTFFKVVRTMLHTLFGICVITLIETKPSLGSVRARRSGNGGNESGREEEGRCVLKHGWSVAGTVEHRLMGGRRMEGHIAKMAR